MCARAHLYPSQEQSHARVWSSVPRVRSSALGRPGSVETLKLAYKYQSISIVNVWPHQQQVQTKVKMLLTEQPHLLSYLLWISNIHCITW